MKPKRPKPKPKPPEPPSEPAVPLRLEYRSPAELTENPVNWRLHPDRQTKALGDLIGEVGWAGALLYNERTNRLIDGHARRELAIRSGETKVPVLVGSWDEATERKILATLDPVGDMAERNQEALNQLLNSLDGGSKDIAKLLADLKDESPAEFPVLDESIEVNQKCPKCGFTWSDGK